MYTFGGMINGNIYLVIIINFDFTSFLTSYLSDTNNSSYLCLHNVSSQKFQNCSKITCFYNITMIQNFYQKIYHLYDRTHIGQDLCSQQPDWLTNSIFGRIPYSCVSESVSAKEPPEALTGLRSSSGQCHMFTVTVSLRISGRDYVRKLLISSVLVTQHSRLQFILRVWLSIYQ